MAIYAEGKEHALAVGRGSHLSTFRLNVSAFYGIGGAIRGYQGVDEEVFGAIMRCPGCILCQKRLRLSWELNECTPLPVGITKMSTADIVSKNKVETRANIAR